MRAPFIVGIFGLAVAVAGFTEWASRRAAEADIKGPQHETVAKPSVAQPALPPPITPADAITKPASADPEGTHVLVLGDTGGVFRLNAVTLSDELAARIDEFLSGPDAEAFIYGRFVIEGHTDNLGTKDTNDRVAFARAFAVRAYLNERYEIPRTSMKIVSYGPDRPVADNATPEGRALNRRVVIKVIPTAH